MSENILIDGKPLHLLRVVDLREELKKRNIKVSGTKVQLQELLIKAISEEQALAKGAVPVEEEENNVDKDSATSNEENSNGSTDNNSVNNDHLETEPKVASISINEEKETIKLTIRSSPRKSEPPPPPALEKHDSETESSSQSEAESRGGSPKIQNDSIGDDKPDSSSINDGPANQTGNDNSARQPAATVTSTNELLEQNHVDATKSSSKKDDNQVGDASEEKEQKPAELPLPKLSEEQSASAAKSHEKSGGVPELPVNANQVEYSNDPKPSKELVEGSLDSKAVKATLSPSSSSSSSKRSSPRKRAIPERAVADDSATASSSSRRRLLSHSSRATTDEAKKADDSKSKPSIRERLLSHSKSINDDDSSKPVQKKRRWGSSQGGESAAPMKKGISSDELKQLISESKSVSESEAASGGDGGGKVSKAAVADNNEEEELTVHSTTNDLTDDNNEPEPKPKEEVKKVDGAFKPGAESDANSNNNKGTKSLSSTEKQTDEQPQQQQRPSVESGAASRTVGPAKNPESTVLFVSGLVRPYTLPQLKKLLNATGSIDEEKFWIDKIKSKCYVVYSTIEEAIKTREALHDLKWPQSSPKNLSVEFATLEDIDRCLHPENYENLPPPQKASPPLLSSSKQQQPVTTVDKPKKDAVIEISKGKYDIIQNEPIRDGKGLAKNSAKDDASARNVREWDRSKVNRKESSHNEPDQENRKRARHSAERDHAPVPEKKEKTRERSKTPEKVKKNDQPLRENRKSESPAKMLEDLFRKTKATPYIYWLPLPDEQVIEKQKQRENMEKERLARLAARRDSASKRENSPPNRNVPMHQNFPRDRPKFQDARRRSPPSPNPPRRKRSISPSPRRHARYSRSRSPDRRRVSPRRRR